MGVWNETLKIYQPIFLDWMGYKITKTNKLTAHHIDKKNPSDRRVPRGKTKIGNIAPLTEHGHLVLNCMEQNNPQLFEEWQDLFRDICSTYAPPNVEHQQRIILMRRKSKENGYD